MNPAFLALSRLRRRRYDECADLCTELLSKNNFDQQAWWMKMRALTLKAFIDDTGAWREERPARACKPSVPPPVERFERHGHTHVCSAWERRGGSTSQQEHLGLSFLSAEMEDEGIAEMLMDDNAMQAAPRPGTSLNRPTTTARLGTQSNRPMASVPHFACSPWSGADTVSCPPSVYMS